MSSGARNAVGSERGDPASTGCRADGGSAGASDGRSRRLPGTAERRIASEPLLEARACLDAQSSTTTEMRDRSRASHEPDECVRERVRSAAVSGAGRTTHGGETRRRVDRTHGIDVERMW